MSALAQENVTVRRYVCNLRGGAQSILAEASDGFLYVVKFLNNLQGPNLAFNESIGTELYRSVGLPVPPWCPVRVTDSFIDANRACWMQTPIGLRRPEAGRCFGSRFMGGTKVRLLEILPRSSFKRIKNRDDFWLAWLVDVCADHADNRQAIFRELPGGALTATFIDHGHMFGGPDGQKQLKFGASAYLDLQIYPKTFSEQFWVTLRRNFSNLDVDKLCEEIENLPDEWKSESAIQHVMCCLERLSSTQFVTTVVATIANSLRHMNERERTDFQFRRMPPTSVLCPGISAPARNPDAVV